jgi:hypothetical protein
MSEDLFTLSNTNTVICIVNIAEECQAQDKNVVLCRNI